MSHVFPSTIIKLNRSILWGRFIHPHILEDGINTDVPLIQGRTANSLVTT